MSTVRVFVWVIYAYPYSTFHVENKHTQTYARRVLSRTLISVHFRSTHTNSHTHTSDSISYTRLYIAQLLPHAVVSERCVMQPPEMYSAVVLSSAYDRLYEVVLRY